MKKIKIIQGNIQKSERPDKAYLTQLLKTAQLKFFLVRSKLFLRIEEVILILLILLNLFDFAEKLSSDFDYIKKTISFILMFYLFYRASLSKQFFGFKNENFDFLIIFSMMSMVMVRNAVAVSLSAEPGFFTPFFNLLKSNVFIFEIVGLYFGLITLLIMAVYTAKKFRIKKPSLLSVLHEKNSEPGWEKSLTNYLVFLAFFLFIFNLVMEWLTIAIDAPMISLGLIFYLLIALKKHHFDPESTIFKVGNFGEKFYDYFVNHFKYSEKLKLGIAGMLILHLITDIGVFIVPAILNLRDPLYQAIFSENHLSIWAIAASVASSKNELLLYLIQYFVATTGFLFLMTLPVMVWRAIYFNRKLKLNKWSIAIFYSSLSGLILTPIFKLVPLQGKGFYGVDIQTVPVTINLFLSIILFATVFLLTFLLYSRLRKTFIFGALGLSSVFFFWYVLNYFLSSINYYSETSILLFQQNPLLLGLIGFHFFLFLMLIIIFYVIGFWFYLLTMKKKITI